MAQPGWFPDPGGQPGMYRYWDGTAWTQQRSAKVVGNGTPPRRLLGAIPLRRWPASSESSVADRVADVDHAVVESSVVQQLEVESHASRQRRLAAAHERPGTAAARTRRPGRAGRPRPRCPAPPMLRSEPEVSLSRRTASGSNCRSILVRAVDTSVSEVE